MKVEIGPFPDGEEERVIKIEIDPYDTWNLDHTLALIILPCLKQFRKSKIGYPPTLTMRKWHAIQDQMIEAMEMIANCEPSAFIEIKEYRKLEKKKQKGCELFGKWFQNLWD